jgi:hypothetical protein
MHYMVGMQHVHPANSTCTGSHRFKVTAVMLSARVDYDTHHDHTDAFLATAVEG